MSTSTATIIRWQVDGQRVDTLVEVDNGVHNVGGYRYFAWQSFTLATDSSIVYGRGDRAVLNEIDVRGREISAFQWNASARMVTPEDRDAIRAFGAAAGAVTGPFALPRRFRVSYVDSASVVGVLETVEGSRVVASLAITRSPRVDRHRRER